MMHVRANRSRAFLLIYLACLSRISPITDNSGLKTLHLIDTKPCFRTLVATLAIAVTPLSACGEASEPTPQSVPAEPQVHLSTCGDKGTLQARFSGAIGANLDWPDDAMDCESMPRPDAEGVRVRFSGVVDEERLAIIIALPDLHVGATGTEFDANVTISVEGSGRFFSTPNLDTCWAAIVVNEPLGEDSATHNVMGGLSCVAPLGEINGDGFVDIQLLRFSGIANWSTS